MKSSWLLIGSSPRRWTARTNKVSSPRCHPRFYSSAFTHCNQYQRCTSDVCKNITASLGARICSDWICLRSLWNQLSTHSTLNVLFLSDSFLGAYFFGIWVTLHSISVLFICSIMNMYVTGKWRQPMRALVYVSATSKIFSEVATISLLFASPEKSETWRGVSSLWWAVCDLWSTC